MGDAGIVDGRLEPILLHHRHVALACLRLAGTVQWADRRAEVVRAVSLRAAIEITPHNPCQPALASGRARSSATARPASAGSATGYPTAACWSLAGRCRAGSQTGR